MAHLLGCEPLDPRLTDPATVNRLRRAKREYILSLTGGDYGRKYLEHRWETGALYESVGVRPHCTVGSTGVYLELLVPLVIRRYRDDGWRAIRACIALNKLINLDIQVILDGYFATRQRHALERSEQLAAVGELAASIAHEVRNPLAGMKGVIEVLRRQMGEDPSRVELMDELMGQIGRLEGLVRDLLTYARPRPLRRRPIPLHDLLKRVMRLVSEEECADSVTFHSEFDPQPQRVMGDPEQLEEVFLNLIHNAVQAMDAGGRLRVETRHGDNEVEIRFQDTGPGIPPEIRARIFQPFFTTKHRGSGLGLPIVRKIVRAHGGDIRVEPAATAGSVACVVLPAEGSG